jgi:hypothetical protein
MAEMTHNPSYWNETLEEVIKDLPWWKRWNIVHPNGHHTYTKESAAFLERNGTMSGFEEAPEEV